MVHMKAVFRRMKCCANSKYYHHLEVQKSIQIVFVLKELAIWQKTVMKNQLLYVSRGELRERW